jgi:hypothetical protein
LDSLCEPHVRQKKRRFPSARVSNPPVGGKAPAQESCAGRKFCLMGYSGAISVTSELVLAGSDDAHIRIYDAATGKVLGTWAPIEILRQ